MAQCREYVGGGSLTRKEYKAEISNIARNNGVNIFTNAKTAQNTIEKYSYKELDTLYEKIDIKYRRKLGQVFTPPKIAKFMATWGIDKNCSSVLDPACGTGVFIEKIFDLKYRGKIYGIDIDPLMIGSAMVKISISHPKLVKNLKLDCKDYLQTTTNKVDFLICNPPYVNFHDFERLKLISHIEDEFNIKLSLLTNLYVLFLIKAKNSVKKNGKIAFITPSEFFYTGYGKAVKKFLLENFTLESFITFNFNKTIFNNALTTSTISFLINKCPDPKHKVTFIKIDDINMINDRKFTIFKKKTKYNTIYQNKIDIEKKWQNYFIDMKTSKYIKNLVPLKTQAKIIRGIATGANKFFTLNDEKKKYWKIEDEFCVPVISRAMQCRRYSISRSDIKNLASDNENIHLLYCFKPPSNNLKKYIKYGNELGISKRYLCTHRSPWYSMERRKPAPILATVFSRDNMRFIHNKSNCLNLAAYHGIYPKFNQIEMIEALLCYLNSNLCIIAQKQNRREYGNGLHKFEPSDLASLPTLPIDMISKKDVYEMSALFRKLSKQPSLKTIKYEIDQKLKEVIAKI